MSYNLHEAHEKQMGYFKNWVNAQKEEIHILENAGFTTDQAIELLKVYSLNGIEVALEN